MKVLKGSEPASGGIAMGRVYLYQQKERKIEEYRVRGEDVEKEIER